MKLGEVLRGLIGKRPVQAPESDADAITRRLQGISANAQAVDARAAEAAQGAAPVAPATTAGEAPTQPVPAPTPVGGK